LAGLYQWFGQDMPLQVFFYVALASTCGYAYLRGEYPEKLCASVLIAGSLFSTLIAILYNNHWHRAGFYIFLVDVAALCILVILALRSDRFWPIWAAAFQLPGVVTHIATMVDPKILPRSYAIAQGFWIYPLLIVLVIGTRSHHKWMLHKNS
jgi:hypothetical protein